MIILIIRGLVVIELLRSGHRSRRLITLISRVIEPTGLSGGRSNTIHRARSNELLHGSAAQYQTARSVVA